MDQDASLVNRQSSVEAKITLVRSLFRGREDPGFGTSERPSGMREE